MMTLKKFVYICYRIFSIPFAKQKRYKDGVEKSRIRMIIDQLKWFLREFSANDYYYLWGLNISKSKQKEFIGRHELMKYRRKADGILLKRNGVFNIGYDVLTKDKFINGNYFAAVGLPVIPVAGLVFRGSFLTLKGEQLSLDFLFDRNAPFILKSISLEASDGFFYCESVNNRSILVNGNLVGRDVLHKKLGTSLFVLQDVVQSHAEYRRFNESALNTTRIVTVLTTNGPVYLGGFQAFATGDARVDAWSQGAVYVGFDHEKGCLKGKGYFHPSRSKIALCDAHPDSNLVFDNYPLPYLKDSVRLCINAHKYLYNTSIVGWDIAVTDVGPLIVEANEKPGMNAFQAINGGSRELILSLLNYPASDSK